MFKNLLVALDGSEPSKKALDVAVGLTNSFKAKLTAVSVVEPIEWTVATTDAIIIDSAQEKMQKQILKDAEKECKEKGVEIKTIASKGHPGDVIIETAKKNGCDLIIMGSRGRTGFDKLLLGSVSDHVIQNARVHVLVVK